MYVSFLISYQRLVLVGAGKARVVLRAPQALEVAAADEQVHLDALDLLGWGGMHVVPTSYPSIRPRRCKYIHTNGGVGTAYCIQ